MTIKKLLIASSSLFACMIIFLSSFTNKSIVSRNAVALQDQRDTIPNHDSVYARVEIEAYYPGGDKAWRTFLEKNLNGDVPAKKKAPAGTYTVVIQFVVDTKGHASEITALTNNGYGMEEEVMRVIRLAPRWNPASQDGRLVKAFRKQPVTFWIEEEKTKKKKNRD